MDNIKIWSSYAKEHGLSYGKCRAMVAEGLLPPPEGIVHNKTFWERYTKNYNQAFDKDYKSLARLHPTDSKTCVVCGELFWSPYPNQTTCGDTFCRNENRRIRVIKNSQKDNLQEVSHE